MYDIGTGEGAKPPSTPRRNAMPRTTRNRTLIAQARVSEAELAKWRAKAAAAGVGLSELLRRAMARTRTWTAGAAQVKRLAADYKEIAEVLRGV